MIELVEITGSMSENVPSTGSGTESNTVIERSRNHRKRNKNVPSTGSGTDSNTVIERSRNHRDENKNVPSTGSGTGSSNNKSFLQILDNLLFLS